jgi:hypothetical protein
MFWIGPHSIYFTKSTEVLVTGFPYVATVGNCLLWTIYSFSNVHDLLFNIVLNICGLLLNLSFSGLYFQYSEGEKRRAVVMQMSAVALVALIGVVLSFVVGSTPVGYLAGSVNVLMYGAFRLLGEFAPKPLQPDRSPPRGR